MCCLVFCIFILSDPQLISTKLHALNEFYTACPVHSEEAPRDQTNSVVSEREFQNMKRDLKKNKFKTSNYKRSKTSAPDPRPSSQTMGILGVLIITVVIGWITLADCSKCFYFLIKKCSKMFVSRKPLVSN